MFLRSLSIGFLVLLAGSAIAADAPRPVIYLWPAGSPTLKGADEKEITTPENVKPGDRIVKIGNREVKNVYDYTYALGEMKAGQEYVFEVMRGAEKLSLKVTPEARK